MATLKHQAFYLLEKSVALHPSTSSGRAGRKNGGQVFYFLENYITLLYAYSNYAGDCGANFHHVTMTYIA